MSGRSAVWALALLLLVPARAAVAQESVRIVPPPPEPRAQGPAPLRPPDFHPELEALARDLVYRSGRPTGPDDDRPDALLATRGDAEFRKLLGEKGYRLLEKPIDDKQNGMQALALGDRAGNRFIVFRGTEPTKDADLWRGKLPPDAVADLDINGNVGSKQYDPYAGKLSEWAARYPGAYVTGHSLGAALAQRYIADHPEAVREAALFNAPSTGYATVQKYVDGGVRVPCTIYVSPYDPVSQMGGNLPLPCRIVMVERPEIRPSKGPRPNELTEGEDLPVDLSLAAHSFCMFCDSGSVLREISYADFIRGRRDTYDELYRRIGTSGFTGAAVATFLRTQVQKPPDGSPTEAMVSAAHQVASLPPQPPARFIGPENRPPQTRPPSGLASAPASGDGGLEVLANEERDGLEKELAWEEQRCACLVEGRRKSPNLETDCNGSFMIGSRDGHIDACKKRIAGLRQRLGRPALANDPEPDPGDRAGSLAEWQRRLACLERVKAGDGTWTSDCNTFLMGSVDEQIAICRQEIDALRGGAKPREGPPPLEEPSDLADADDPLGPRPWDRPKVQQLMDEWLRGAVAAVLPDGKEVRYNEWAQPLAPGARSTGKPDHPADWSRSRYLWETRQKWTSTNLCSLGTYVEQRMAGKDVSGCREKLEEAASAARPQPRPPSAADGSASAAPTSPPASFGWSGPIEVTGGAKKTRQPGAPDDYGWSGPIHVTGSATQARPLSARAAPSVPAAPAPRETWAEPSPEPDDSDADAEALRALAGVVGQIVAGQQAYAAAPGYGAGPSKAAAHGSGAGFVGAWSCSWRDGSGGFQNDTPMTIRPAGSQYEAVIGDDRLTGRQTGPESVHLEASGQQHGTAFSASFDFESQGNALVGGGEIRTRDDAGTHAERYSGRCGRAGS